MTPSILIPLRVADWSRVQRTRSVGLLLASALLIATSSCAAAAPVDVVGNAPPPGSTIPPTSPATIDDAVDATAPKPTSFVVDDAFLARCARTAAYSERYDGRTMLVMHKGQIIFEQYASGVTGQSHFELASGTKSFVGVIAVAAAEDGLLHLDERASDTLVEWKDDPNKSGITIRQILTLTSGIGSGRVGRPPAYADAIQQPREAATGSAFIYGPAPFQVFGEILRRKLVAAGAGESVTDYVKRRIFAPIGLEVGSWRIGRDGNPHLPSGVSLTARDWAKFGEFVRNFGAVGETQVIAAAHIESCMLGTAIKPEYGLCWWLAWFDGQGLNPEELLRRGNTRGGEPREAEIWMAAGLGNQRLYVIPSMELVIVRQATLNRRSGYNDKAFITMLLDLEPVAREPVEGPRADPPRRRLRDRLRERN